jgi:hypothetical protein
MGRAASLVLLGAVAVLGYQWLAAESWSGFVYPDRGNLQRHIEIGPYKGLEECRQAALRALSTTVTPGDYECGLNCRTQAGLTVKVCKETSR